MHSLITAPLFGCFIVTEIITKSSIYMKDVYNWSIVTISYLLVKDNSASIHHQNVKILRIDN